MFSIFSTFSSLGKITYVFNFSCERDPGCHGITFDNGKCYKLMNSGGSVLATTIVETFSSLLLNRKNISILSAIFNLFQSKKILTFKCSKFQLLYRNRFNSFFLKPCFFKGNKLWNYHFRNFFSSDLLIADLETEITTLYTLKLLTDNC